MKWKIKAMFQTTNQLGATHQPHPKFTPSSPARNDVFWGPALQG